MSQLDFKKLNYTLILVFVFIYTVLITYEYKKDMLRKQAITGKTVISIVKKSPQPASILKDEKQAQRGVSVETGSMD